nr:uncharacterized protein LOC129413398 [Misgurnus anguillicaudatus]
MQSPDGLKLSSFLIKTLLILYARAVCDHQSQHQGRASTHTAQRFTQKRKQSTEHQSASRDAPPPKMEELLKHLTEVSIRQQQIMEHMASRQEETKRELAALRIAAAQQTPLPDHRVQATQLLPKMTAHDEVAMYLQMFETVAVREAWPKDEWARIVAPLLTGEAQRAYFALMPERSASYEELRKEILGRVGFSPISATQLFHEWTFDPQQPA